MNLKTRLERLEAAASDLTPHCRTFDGTDWEGFWDAFAASLEPASVPLAEAIAERIDAGDDEAGFLWWLAGLTVGWWTLPMKIPHAVIVFYHEHDVGANGHAMPFWRCRRCRMALPHGKPPPFTTCPVCDYRDLESADLSQPIGTAWRFESTGERRDKDGLPFCPEAAELERLANAEPAC